jgi:5'-nucleotidase
VLPEVKAAGAEVVVLLAHVTGECGPIASFRLGGPCDPGQELGALVDGLPRGAVDVIVAGHAHNLIATRKGDTFVVEGWAQGRVLNRVDLVVGEDGVRADASTLHAPWMMLHDQVDQACEGGEHPLEPRDLGGRVVAPSSEALDLVRRLEAETDGGLCERVACAARPLLRSRTTTSDIGRLITDGMLRAFPGADVAVQNSGGLRADLPSGVVRRMHVQDTMPFPNQTMLVEMSGEQLRLLLRIGSAGAHGAMQVAGAWYRYDPARKGGTDLDGDGKVALWEQDRLCDVRVGGKPLDPEASYKVVVPDFLFSGGDDMGPAFREAKVLARGPLLREALEQHLRAHEGCLGTATAPEPERVEAGACGAAVKKPVHSTR